MRERQVRRYSACFKRQVIAELERGRFDSLEAARRHYEIGGSQTLQKWLRHYGRNELQAKVVRVEQAGEADRIRQLQQQVAELQRALGQTQAENVLNAAFLQLACEQLGQDVGAFKKKAAGTRSTGRRHKAKRSAR
jgi:transposase-like protein